MQFQDLAESNPKSSETSGKRYPYEDTMKTAWMLTASLLALSATAQMNPEQTASTVTKSPLKRIATTGQVTTYSMVVETEFGGSPLRYTADLVETVKEAAGSTIVVSSEQKNGVVVIGGNEMPAPGEIGALTTMTVGPDGRVAALEGEMVDASVRRMANLQAFVYPSEAVGPGDKWEAKIDANGEQGTEAVEIGYEVTGVETVDGALLFKVKVEAREASGSDPAQMSGTVWIHPATGQMHKYEGEWKDVPIAGQIISGKVSLVKK